MSFRPREAEWVIREPKQNSEHGVFTPEITIQQENSLGEAGAD
jgi:hypothetical protein